MTASGKVYSPVSKQLSKRGAFVLALICILVILLALLHCSHKLALGPLVTPAELRALRVPDGLIDQAAWRPDSAALACSVARPSTRPSEFAECREVDLVLVELGGASQVLTKGDRRDEVPCWSPDGKRIGFVRILEGYRRQLRVFDTRTNTDELITAFESSLSPHLTEWSPDGSWVALTEGNCCSDDQSRPDKVTLFDVTKPGAVPWRWQLPAHYGLGEIAWSPDGSTLAVTGISHYDRDNRLDKCNEVFGLDVKRRQATSLFSLNPHQLAIPLRWSDNSRSLFYADVHYTPIKCYCLDVTTHKRCYLYSARKYLVDCWFYGGVFSAGGKTAIFSVSDWEGTWPVLLVAGQHGQYRMDLPSRRYYGDWLLSPDGKWLYSRGEAALLRLPDPPPR